MTLTRAWIIQDGKAAPIPDGTILLAHSRRTDMVRHRLATLALFTMTAALPPSVVAQARSDPATLIAAQKEAMVPLGFMDGVWRGPAWTILPSGERHNVTQTERIGPLLDGSVKVIEGRGYDTDGKVTFNAFGTISY